jgi:choline transport protein
MLTDFPAREVEDASLNTPRAMWWSCLLNVVIDLGTLATILFCIEDPKNAINSNASCLILFQNTRSNAVTVVLMIILLILVFSGNITAWPRLENSGLSHVIRVSFAPDGS